MDVYEMLQLKSEVNDINEELEKLDITKKKFIKLHSELNREINTFNTNNWKGSTRSELDLIEEKIQAEYSNKLLDFELNIANINNEIKKLESKVSSISRMLLEEEI